MPTLANPLLRIVHSLAPIHQRDLPEDEHASTFLAEILNITDQDDLDSFIGRHSSRTTIVSSPTPSLQTLIAARSIVRPFPTCDTHSCP